MTFADRQKSIEELYAGLLRRKRKFERDEENGTAKCLHCQQQKSAHCHDGRCTVAATSRNFRNESQPEIDRTNRAITLIEELLEL